MHPNATPEDVERDALAALTSPEKVRAAQALGVDVDAFQVASHQDAWKYLCERAELGEAATLADILSVTGVALPADITDSENLVGVLSQLGLQRKVSRVLIEQSEVLIADPRAALAGLLGDLGGLATSATTGGHLRRFEADAPLRLSEFETRQEEGSSTGLPTGLPIFDDRGDYWQPGEVVAIIGATNAGKSFLVLRLAAEAYFTHGRRVLCLSPESSVRDIEYRLDPIIARKLGLVLSNSKLRNGKQDLAEYRTYMEALAAHNEKVGGSWVTRDAGSLGSFSIEDVIAQAREHLSNGSIGAPDVLLIDGFHLIRGEGKSWESMQEAALQVKGLAQDLGIVVMTVSQAQRTVLQDVGDAPDLAHAAYGLGLMEASNRVISMGEKRGDAFQRIFKVPKYRDGERVTQRQTLKFDVDAGIIEQVTAKVTESTGEVSF